MTSLLIGNGVNYLGEDVVGWTDLLNTLIKKIGKLEVINTDEKPFLHLYEEIFTRAEKYTDKKEDEIKRFIVDEIKTMTPNPYHNKIMNLPFNNILTLNYDYSFTENSMVKNRETKYSLKRYQRNNLQKVWHIHGELNNQDSIMLGYSHYMDSIHNIQSYLNTKDKMDNNNQTWVDIFLTDDIYILGAGLDFEELDIWWLLSYRNRMILEPKTDEINVQYSNKITFINIVQEDDYEDVKDTTVSCEQQLQLVEKLVNSKIKKKKNEAKLSMLEVLGVEVQTYHISHSESYQKAYNEILTDLSNIL